MSPAVARVLERLDGVQRTRCGWRARCPAHHDRTPSLDIREGDDGRALLQCRARCRTEAVLTALDLRWAHLFADVSELHRRERPRRRSPLDEARHAIIAEARRQRIRLAPYREVNADADSLRVAWHVTTLARRVGTDLGDCALAWNLLGAAAGLETDLFATEAELDAEVATR
jgi:hypothetical protein